MITVKKDQAPERFYEKFNPENNQQATKKPAKLPSMQRVKHFYCLVILSVAILGKNYFLKLLVLK